MLINGNVKLFIRMTFYCLLNGPTICEEWQLFYNDLSPPLSSLSPPLTLLSLFFPHSTLSLLPSLYSLSSSLTLLSLFFPHSTLSLSFPHSTLSLLPSLYSLSFPSLIISNADKFQLLIGEYLIGRSYLIFVIVIVIVIAHRLINEFDLSVNGDYDPLDQICGLDQIAAFGHADQSDQGNVSFPLVGASELSLTQHPRLFLSLLL